MSGSALKVFRAAGGAMTRGVSKITAVGACMEKPGSSRVPASDALRELCGARRLWHVGPMLSPRLNGARAPQCRACATAWGQARRLYSAGLSGTAFAHLKPIGAADPSAVHLACATRYHRFGVGLCGNPLIRSAIRDSDIFPTPVRGFRAAQASDCYDRSQPVVIPRQRPDAHAIASPLYVGAAT